MKLATLALAALATVTWAQPPAGGRPQGATPPIDEIKSYLALTDSQVQSLRQIATQFRQAAQSLQEEMQTKQTALRQLAGSNSTDANRIGTLFIEMQNIRKRLTDLDTRFRDQANNVLNAAQKTKVKALEDAARLREEIQQATMLHLMARPEGGPGGPGGFGAQAGHGRFGGPGGPRGGRPF